MEFTEKPLVGTDEFGAVLLAFLPDYFKDEFGKAPIKHYPLSLTTLNAPRELAAIPGNKTKLLANEKREVAQPPLRHTGAPPSIIEQLKSL